MEDLETTIMELLVNAGAARSAALTALQMARKGDFEEAEKAMEERPHGAEFLTSGAREVPERLGKVGDDWN